MRILVTGGAGFIGSHLIDRLVASGHDIVVLDNLDPQVHGEDATSPRNIKHHLKSGTLEFIKGDIRSPEDVGKALEGVEAVAHLAAAVGVGQSMYKPLYYTDVNVNGQSVLMEEMLRRKGQIQRFVVASSMSIYGEGAYSCGDVAELLYPPARPDSQMASSEWELRQSGCAAPLIPRQTPERKRLDASSIYAITKKNQEEMALVFGGAYDIPSMALRFFNVYGSKQALSNPYTGVAAIFMSRLKNGNPPVIFEDGRQSRDFIHVFDVARAVHMALESTSTGAVNIGTGVRTSILDVATVLAEKLGVDVQPKIVGQYRSGDIRHCIADPERAKELLGFSAEIAFEQGVQELLEWAEEEEARDMVDASFEELDNQGLVR